MKSDLKEVY